MEYKIIEAKDAVRTLQEEVDRHIQQGWLPAGGVAVAYSPQSGHWCFYQAMTRGQAAQLIAHAER